MALHTGRPLAPIAGSHTDHGLRAIDMAGASISGGDALIKALEKIARKMSGTLEVGFMDGATYPDGTLVAAVAFWNEYGSSDTPARPFFRTMVAAESPTWPGKLAKAGKFTHYDGPRVLAFMGEDIKGALQQSINEFTTPALASSTIKAKGFEKPLIATGHMLNSITYKVEP